MGCRLLEELSVRFVQLWRSRSYALAGLRLLLGDLLQGVAQVAQRGREQAGELGHRRLHAAGQLREEDLAGRERCEPGHGVSVDRAVAEDATRDPDDPVVRAGRVDHRLGGRRLVRPERDGAGAGQERVEGVPTPSSAAIRMRRFLTTR